jgi:hypothetical protein
LYFLQQLLGEAERRDSDQSRALEAWCGWTSASRDFTAQGIAIEVKATAQARRRHLIAGLKQLEVDTAAGETALYLYSVSLCPDPSGSIHIVDLVNAIHSHLSSAALRDEFVEKLSQYGSGSDQSGPGLRWGQLDRYRLADPYVLTGFQPLLFRVDDRVKRVRTSSFVEGVVPVHSTDVRYTLDLSSVTDPGLRLGVEEARGVLGMLLGGPS